MTKDIESEIQSWIAKESEQSCQFAGDALVVGADELAEFVTEVFKKLEGFVVVPVESLKVALKWMDEDIDCWNLPNDYFVELFEHKPILEKTLVEAARGGNHE